MTISYWLFQKGFKNVLNGGHIENIFKNIHIPGSGSYKTFYGRSLLILVIC
jgi:hypothetical protein